MNTKEQLINQLIKDNGYKKYLEIGVQFGVCIQQVMCPYKVGVDPSNLVRGNVGLDRFHCMTSDEFFKQNDETFGLIFIDGLHHAEQVLADIVNSAAILDDGGTIVVHDLLPDAELHQEVPRRSRRWMGDVWKAWYIINKGGYDIVTKTHDFDCGVGTLQLGREGLDDLLVNYSSMLEDIALINYKDDFEDYLNKVL